MRTKLLAAAISAAFVLSGQVSAGEVPKAEQGQDRATLAQRLADFVGTKPETLEANAARIDSPLAEERVQIAPYVRSVESGFKASAGAPLPNKATGYNTDIRSRNTDRQQLAANAEKADELYRYSMTISNEAKRKRVLQEAKALGSIKAERELRHY